MSKIWIIISAILFSTLSYSTFTHAENIKIGLSQQGVTNQKINRPKLGMSMEKVKAYFGEPVQVSGPTGKPAIYLWKYAEFSVYFEGEYVLHSVLHPVEINPVDIDKIAKPAQVEQSVTQ